MPHELPNNLILRILGNKEILGKSQNVIDFVLSPTTEMKILSVPVKLSWKKEVELFPKSAILNEN